MLKVFGLALIGVSLATGCSDSGETPRPSDPGPVHDKTQEAGDLPYDLNDVSFLYPLPPADALDALLPLSRAGERGPLLSAALYAKLDGSINLSHELSSFHVVGVRVDPCFPSTAPPVSSCIKEIRLVAQPILTDPATHTVTTRDVAIHLFYDLDDGEWSGLLSQLAALKKLAGNKTDHAPLEVHPVMLAEGLDGPYAQALHRLVLEGAGDRNLVRVATSVAIFDQSWDFRSFDRSGDSLTATPIPRIGTETTQHFANSAGTHNIGTMSPRPTPDDLSLLLDEPKLSSAPDADVATAARAAVASENPNLTNRVTTDCMTCHVATRARGLAETIRHVDTEHFDERFRDPRFDLRLDSPVATDIVSQRAFGYLDAKPAFNQRMIHETATVAAALSTK